MASALMEVMKVCHQAVVDLRSPGVKKKKKEVGVDGEGDCSLQMYKEGKLYSYGSLVT